MAKFAPHPQHSGKPKSQGNAGSPNTQKPRTSGKPAKGGEAPTTAQGNRGYRTNGKSGSGNTANKPKPFKG